LKALLTIVQRLCRIAGFAGLILGAWALFDPSAFPQADFGMLDPPSPRWRGAFVIVFSILLIVLGSGRPSHREGP